MLRCYRLSRTIASNGPPRRFPLDLTSIPFKNYRLIATSKNRDNVTDTNETRRSDTEISASLSPSSESVNIKKILSTGKHQDGFESANFLERETYRDIRREKRHDRRNRNVVSDSDSAATVNRPYIKRSISQGSEKRSPRKQTSNRSTDGDYRGMPSTTSHSAIESSATGAGSPKVLRSPYRSNNRTVKTSKFNSHSSESFKSKSDVDKLEPFKNFTVHDTPYSRSFEVDSSKLSYSALEVPNQPQVPELSHNLDRVLFSPGVHVLKDKRTNVYNFTPYLENIMSIKDFDFDFIAKYVPSGKDSTLAKLAKENGRKYTGSTSSLTSVLTQFHHLLSHKRAPQIMSMSKFFRGHKVPFSAIQKLPVSVFLRYNPETDTYSVDADKSLSGDIIVSILGQQLEAMLTTPEVEFENYRKNLSHKLDPKLKGGSNTYNYTQCGDFLMRSQLDCYDERLPGTGMFDLKTRAVCAVRHDMDYVQIQDGSNYHINKIDGEFESFAREWYELIKSTMFKYSLQARIGRMDGIFLAYHNVRKMFGFQYVPLSEMDQIFHTSDLIPEPRSEKSASSSRQNSSKAMSEYVPLDDRMAECASIIADNEFKLSLKMFNQILDKIIDSHHEKAASFNLVFHASSAGTMNVFVKPMLERDIEGIQTTGYDEKAGPRPSKISSPSDSERANDGVSSEQPTSLSSSLWPNYSQDSDPHTIIMHSNSNPNLLPPDVKVYQVDVRSYVNGEFVPGDKHPHMEKDSDIWSLNCVMHELRQPAAERRFSRTFKLNKTENRITSTPQLERLDETEEELRRSEALKKLELPNAKQEFLRYLSIKGENLQREWEAEYGDKEKFVWFPKPMDRVETHQRSGKS